MAEAGTTETGAQSSVQVTQKNKRKRVYSIQKCTARLRVPADTAAPIDTAFDCTLDAHSDEVQHTQNGIVHLQDGTARSYVITWQDLGRMTPRFRRKAAKAAAK